MKNRQIVFTAPNKAELIATDLAKTLAADQIMVKMAYTAVSAGTERSNLIGDPNISSLEVLKEVKFPRELGYSGSGTVTATGVAVTGIVPGDRVVVHFGKHRQYNIVNERNVILINDENISLTEAALVVIAGFSLAGIRKTKLETGESVLVAGLGILGLFAVQLSKLAGGVPIIAVDFHEDRRRLALDLGADLVLDPADEFCYQKTIQELTFNRGVNVAIEVTGSGKALITTLGSMAKFGRVSLLGCTRTPVDNVDFYHLVHGKGVSLIGANHFARPQNESASGNWTARDDCFALLDLLKYKRINFKKLINKIESPLAADEVYQRLAFDQANFPVGVLFDWQLI